MLKFVVRKGIAAALCAGLLASCKSIKEPSEVFVLPDYTEDDIAAAEAKRIDGMLEEKPVQALWRATFLKDGELVGKCADNLAELYRQALEEKQYLDAARYYHSLKAAGFSGLDQLAYSEEQLQALYMKDVPGFQTDEKLLPQTMADCVNATVTVVVDLGIKIKYGSGYAEKSMGSGFFIDRRGYIVTNHHVIRDLVDTKRKGYARLYIKLADDPDTLIPARLIGYDAALDFALLKTEAAPPFVLSLGADSELAVGDRISVIGTPLGILDGTITSGVVSSVNRRLLSSGSVLQIDAAVTFGNSGGPCLDSRMVVQAIVFSGATAASGLNFAIPVEYLRQDLPYLYAGGERTHAWVGAFGQTLKEGSRNTGVKLMYVMPGGTISRAAVPENAIVKFINGRRILGIEDIQDTMRVLLPETIVSCSYQDGDETKDALLYLTERPEQPGYEIYNSDLITGSFFPILGMKLEPSSTASNRKYTVTDIIKGSAADETGFSATDPVYISNVVFNDDNSVIYVQISTRRKKKGYLDLSLGLGAQLDSPYYF